MELEEDCKCIKIIGHLGDVRWLLWPREYKPSPGYLAVADWNSDPFIWLHYVISSDGLLPGDDVLLSTDSRYWCIHDVQRYFVGELHCEQILFTYQYPNLRMPTRLGSYFWRANTAMKILPAVYQKEFNRSMELTLQFEQNDPAPQNGVEKRSNRSPYCIGSINKTRRLRLFEAKNIFPTFTQYFKNRLQLVSFENLCCKRLEGVRLIQQLATFNAESLKYLFLWRFVLPNENPSLINYSYIKGSGQYIPRPGSKHCFLRSLGGLTNLRVLALEYSYIADSTGGAIIGLLPILKRPHFRLQLICREDHIPGRTNAALGVGGHNIPDKAWRRVTVACPDLYLLMAFVRIRDYDNVRRFLTPSIPLCETHLQFGVDLTMRQRQDSDVSCFVRHIAFRYASTLLTVSIHQWRFAEFPLRRVFELMPRLVRFFYVGKVRDENDLRTMLNSVACGVHDRLKQIHIQVQDEESRRDYWNTSVTALVEQYSEIMELFEIVFYIGIYKN